MDPRGSCSLWDEDWGTALAEAGGSKAGTPVSCCLQLQRPQNARRPSEGKGAGGSWLRGGQQSGASASPEGGGVLGWPLLGRLDSR